MNIFKFVFQSRGLGNFARRTAQIASRFGPSPGRMGERFDRFIDVLADYGIRPTFPITALPMSRNPGLAQRLLERGAELAVHAWSHIDLTTLDYAGQSDHMGRAVRLFRENAIPFSGFRAPYLHWNQDTMRVVEDFKFRYSSNQAVWWDVINREMLTKSQAEGLQRGFDFYQPTPASSMRVLPTRRRGFVEIPVSLPDDEIPLDRMYIHDADFLGRMWLSILDASYERGELFTLQLHPERIDFFTGALRSLLGTARAKKPGVWIATLDEIAQWWVEKSQNRTDFIREGNGHRVDIRVCDGTSVIVRENALDRVVEPGTFSVSGDARPCVGVSPGSDRIAIQALTELGHVVEVGVDPNMFAVHLGVVGDESAEAIRLCAARIEECRGPLVRFGVWPRGNRSALSVTGDIDALTIWDFVHRFRGA